jgi:hypothetical protein
VLRVDVAAAQRRQLTQRKLPNAASSTSARYRSGITSTRATTWPTDRTGLSGDRSSPAPLTRQGFRCMMPSSTAVLMMAFISLQALATEDGLAPESTRRLRRRTAPPAAGL